MMWFECFVKPNTPPLYFPGETEKKAQEEAIAWLLEFNMSTSHLTLRPYVQPKQQKGKIGRKALAKVA